MHSDYEGIIAEPTLQIPQKCNRGYEGRRATAKSRRGRYLSSRQQCKSRWRRVGNVDSNLSRRPNCHCPRLCQSARPASRIYLERVSRRVFGFPRVGPEVQQVIAPSLDEATAAFTAAYG